jgi:putative spermidine/putrescine transport system ATP-binding protein
VTHDQDEAFSLSDRILLMRAGRIEQEGTPEALYAAPRTRFAAAFLGVRNILDAEVRGGAARLADGTVLRVCGPDGACAVAFRPGAVELGHGQSATVHRVSFAGDMLHVFLRSGPVEICAHARPDPELRPGRETRWHVPPEACRVLRE